MLTTRYLELECQLSCTTLHFAFVGILEQTLSLFRWAGYYFHPEPFNRMCSTNTRNRKQKMERPTVRMLMAASI
jgi:hypothetical protein